MKTSDFDYHLPRNLIAQHPARRRAESRMLVLNRREQSLTDSRFSCLPDYLDSSYFLVLNNSMVFKARIYGKRATGGKVEIFLVRRIENRNSYTNCWKAMVRPSGRIRAEEKIYFDSRNSVTIIDEPGKIERQISFPSGNAEKLIISRYGQVPLPPYIKRSADSNDLRRYQTIYADPQGSVAAPTAGLHFDKSIFGKFDKKNIAREFLTLHVGPGTFKPVTSKTVEDHIVDPEYAEISKSTASAINDRKSDRQKLLAVGTTSVRTLEAAADRHGKLPVGFSEMVDLYVYPPYRFRIVDAILTNFHLPRSSLLMLISAFCDHEFLMKAYKHAIDQKYRFYSYGDCMLIL